MISDFGKEAEPGLSVPCQVRSFLTLDLSAFFEAARLTQPLYSSRSFLSSVLCSLRWVWTGYPCHAPGGLAQALRVAGFLPAITMWEIRGAAADKGISRPSESVCAGRVISGLALLHVALDSVKRGHCRDNAEITTLPHFDIRPNVCGRM
ncbi:hypothetical protein PBY51_007437 [Eleginops maclovinus]|uniref:Uncharacterized protein n=1 Tax=Eleginops maclovinus TaxID=56733 RepID=A0AAN7X7Q6_ELEMC|nr:hypothetical protein PBY51_007437 [Eleginops maclovinus]